MTSIARFSTGANLLRSGVASISFADIIAVFYARAFVFFLLRVVKKIRVVRSRCSNCFSSEKNQKKKKISGSRRLSRLLDQ
jgi:hypothetical protein